MCAKNAGRWSEALSVHAVEPKSSTASRATSDGAKWAFFSCHPFHSTEQQRSWSVGPGNGGLGVEEDATIAPVSGSQARPDRIGRRAAGQRRAMDTLGLMSDCRWLTLSLHGLALRCGAAGKRGTLGDSHEGETEQGP